MTIAADLHVHTKASDGLLTPTEVVQLAAQRKLTAIAITDHDTVAGIEEAALSGQKTGVTVIPGIEFSTEYKGEEVHILGYCFDYKSDAITSLFQKLHDSRLDRAERMVKKLQQLGFGITLAEVCQKAGDAAPNRPHIARILVHKGYFKTVSDVFEVLLNAGKPAFVERYKLTPQDAIEKIVEAEGFTSWAHPGLVKKDYFLEEFIQSGLTGLEVYHPDHSPHLARHYHQLAISKGLLITGGSDFHGNEPGRIRNLASYGLQIQEFRLFQLLKGKC